MCGGLLPRLLISPSLTGRTHGAELLHTLLQSTVLRLNLNRVLQKPDQDPLIVPTLQLQTPNPSRPTAASARTLAKRVSALATPAPEVIDLSMCADDAPAIALVLESNRSEHAPGALRFGGGASAAATARGRARRQSAASLEGVCIHDLESNQDHGSKHGPLLNLSHATAVDLLAGILEAFSFQQDPDQDPDRIPKSMTVATEDQLSERAHVGLFSSSFLSAGSHSGTSRDIHASGNSGLGSMQSMLTGSDTVRSGCDGGSNGSSSSSTDRSVRWGPFALQRRALALVGLLLEARESGLLRVLAGREWCNGDIGGGAVRRSSGDGEDGEGCSWPPGRMGLTQRLVGLLDEVVSVSGESLFNGKLKRDHLYC